MPNSKIAVKNQLFIKHQLNRAKIDRESLVTTAIKHDTNGNVIEIETKNQNGELRVFRLEK